MLLDQIYKRRFEDAQKRKALWDVLVTEFFQKYVDKKDTVLDLPCGYSEFINTIKCKERIAIDLNPDAKKYVGKGVKFIKASSTKLPLKANSVDKVFISNFFEHLTHDDIAGTVKELLRVVKKGGQVIVLQPNIRFAAKDYWMFFDHITAVDDRALDEIFTITGFTLRQRILRFLPFTTQSRVPAKPIFVKLYLRFPIVWRIMGKQTLLVFEK